MLEDSTRECDTTLALDSGNWQFRSCTWGFMELGKTTRAMDFIRLDAGSEWASYVVPSLLLREGKVEEARKAVKKMPTAPHYHRDLLEACLEPRVSPELDRIVNELETSGPKETDPENAYYQASILAFCGKKPAAVNLLANAILREYCAYSQLRSDPLLVNIRGTSQYDQLLAAAKQCQQRYLTGQD